jgi:hypothetical protein
MPVCLGTNAELVPMSSIDLHACLSWDQCWTYPHVQSFSFISFSTERLQVSLGLPHFLVPVGVHLNATLGMEVGCIRHTWPIHVHLRLFISWDSVVVLVLLYSSSFEMVFGQKMRSILRRHRVWKASSLVVMAFVTFQDSAPYRRTPSTLLLKILTLVWLLIFDDLQMLRSAAYAPGALTP